MLKHLRYEQNPCFSFLKARSHGTVLFGTRSLSLGSMPGPISLLGEYARSQVPSRGRVSKPEGVGIQGRWVYQGMRRVCLVPGPLWGYAWSLVLSRGWVYQGQGECQSYLPPVLPSSDGQQAGGTRPTGMLSCLVWSFNFDNKWHSNFS